MAFLAYRYNSSPEQALTDFGQAEPDVVEPPDNPRPPGHRELALRSDRQDARTLQGPLHRAQIVRADLYIGVKVNPRKALRG
jgi:hypothetical protein